ncbi:MAG: hypothetical protein WCA81_19425 [Rhizomicrobium sp.]
MDNHRTVLSLLAALFVFGSAAAQDASSSLTYNGQDPPKSIWQAMPGGDSIHVQSGMHCPLQVGDYQRTRITVYSPSGLDVSCNYVNPKQSIVTMYLTRRSATTLADDFKEAQRELLAVTPSAVPLPEADQKSIASNLPWQQLIYSEKNGYVRSGIWIADLVGWTLEFRATYMASDEQSALVEMAALADTAQASAGPELTICAKSSVPARHGEKVTDKDEIQSAVMMATLLGAMSQGTKGESGAEKEPVRIIHWCAEGLVPGVAKPILLWHGAFDDGSDASADRVTPVTIGTPPILMSAPDALADLANDDKNKNGPSTWIVSLQNEKKTWIFAIYHGRPEGAALASLMNDILDRKAVSIGGYSTDGKSINIDLPSKN